MTHCFAEKNIMCQTVSKSIEIQNGFIALACQNVPFSPLIPVCDLDP